MSLDLQPLTSLPPLPPCTKQAARRARVWAGWLAVLCHKSVRPWCVYCAKTLEDRCRRGRAKAGGSLKKSAYWENHALDCGHPHVTTTIAQRCYPVLEPTGH